MGQRKYNEPDCETILGIIQLADQPLNIAQIMAHAGVSNRPKVSILLKTLLTNGLILKNAGDPPAFIAAQQQADHTLKASAFKLVGDFGLPGNRVNPEAILALLQLASSPLSISEILSISKLTHPILIRQAVEGLVATGRAKIEEGESPRYYATDLSKPNLRKRIEPGRLRSKSKGSDIGIDPSIILGFMQLFPHPVTAEEMSDFSGVSTEIIKMKLKNMTSSRVVLEMSGTPARYTILKAAVPDYSGIALEYVFGNH